MLPSSGTRLMLPGLRAVPLPLGVRVPPAQAARRAAFGRRWLCSAFSAGADPELPGDVTAQQRQPPGSSRALSSSQKTGNCSSEGNVMSGGTTLTTGPLNVIYTNVSSNNSVCFKVETVTL